MQILKQATKQTNAKWRNRARGANLSSEWDKGWKMYVLDHLTVFLIAADCSCDRIEPQIGKFLLSITLVATVCEKNYELWNPFHPLSSGLGYCNSSFQHSLLLPLPIVLSKVVVPGELKTSIFRLNSLEVSDASVSNIKYFLIILNFCLISGRLVTVEPIRLYQHVRYVD